ncbi:MAG TPA: sigma-70 family RNA polymerase sigma factor [Solirubrobacteraceae bacterium]|nr:sigma-70 family RNA polymerase sigma factor [Solirubrobacteraceae bacterium]
MPVRDAPALAGADDQQVDRSADANSYEERLVRRAVDRAKQGDRDGVRYLYMRYADNVYGYVRTIVRDHHDAEDVTQQVFAKLITAIAKYEPCDVPFIAWLLRMSRNVALDTVRARRTTPVAEIFGSNDASGEEGPERARSLHAAFATLPEDQRQVVVLRHVLGLSPVEIAEQLGRTSSSVYGLHHRGRRAMLAELERLDSVPLTARARLAVAA